MFALQSRLHFGSKCLTKRTPYVVLFTKYCKKCSQNIKAGDKGDVSEEVSNKTEDKPLRGREISLLKPVDTRLPFPGNIGISPVFGHQQMNTREKPNAHLELTDELSEMTSYFQDDLVDTWFFHVIVKECPQLLYNDIQLLMPAQVSDLKATLVTFHRKKNDERNNKEILEHLVKVSQETCEKLENFKYWAFFLNPFDVKSKWTSSSFETAQRFRQSSFSVNSSKRCKVITHRNWGRNSFIGSLFTNADCNSHELRSVLDETSSLLVHPFSQ